MFVSSIPSCLCFPALPPFNFKDSDFLIMYPFIDGKSLHSFPSMFLSGDSQEDTNGVSSSSFFILFFSDGFNSSFVDHILSSFQMLSHAGASHNRSPLSLHIRSAEDISEDSCFHSQSVQVILRLLSHSSHLILPVKSLFQAILQQCFFRVGPNPQEKGTPLK